MNGEVLFVYCEHSRVAGDGCDECAAADTALDLALALPTDNDWCEGDALESAGSAL